AEVSHLRRQFYQPGCILDRASQHVSCHPPLRSCAPVAEYPVLSARVAAPFLHQCPERLSATQVAPLFCGTNLTSIGWLLYLQWAYASAQPEMIAGFVTPAYRTLVRSRFLTIPIVATLTMLMCFWSTEILLAVYAVLLPWYMIPSQFDQQPGHSVTPASHVSDG